MGLLPTVQSLFAILEMLLFFLESQLIFGHGKKDVNAPKGGILLSLPSVKLANAFSFFPVSVSRIISTSYEAAAFKFLNSMPMGGPSTISPAIKKFCQSAVP